MVEDKIKIIESAPFSECKRNTRRRQEGQILGEK